VDGEPIELNPKLGPVENAQAYFSRYRKAREAEARVPGLVQQARQAAEYLAQLHTLVEVADHMDAIRALRREIAAATTGAAEPTRKRSARQPKVSRAPYRRTALADGWEALVGTSAEGNAAVTFDLARPDDLWLHARGVPGAHVILHTKSSAPPDAVIERAAELAAWHSGARTAGAVEVDVAPRRYVKKIPNGPPGLVRYSNERTVRVTPRSD
jgi:predicted ribosome quality control (RQC) complex YloA/Tae2 family protein